MQLHTFLLSEILCLLLACCYVFTSGHSRLSTDGVKVTAGHHGFSGSMWLMRYEDTNSYVTASTYVINI